MQIKKFFHLLSDLHARLQLRVFRASFFIVLVFFIGNAVGTCRAESGFIGRQEGAHNKPLMRDSAPERHNVPFSASNAGHEISDLNGSAAQDMRATMSGLQEAGFSLPQIVTFLKNSGKSASEIGMACIQAGFAGAVVFDALCQADFSLAAVETAVPASLRMNQPQLSLIGNEGDKKGGRELLSPGQGSIQNTEKNNPVNPAMGMPAARGIQFNGLGNWQRFQEQRFHSMEKE